MKRILLLALVSTILFGCKKTTQETTSPALNPITISITIGEETSNIVRVK